jgi:hypothetical protein
MSRLNIFRLAVRLIPTNDKSLKNRERHFCIMENGVRHLCIFGKIRFPAVLFLTTYTIPY